MILDIILAVLLSVSVWLNWELWNRCVMYREQRNRLRRSVTVAQLSAVATSAVAFWLLRKKAIADNGK